MLEPRQDFGVGAVVGQWAGSGHLLVAPGKLELHAGPLTGRLSGVSAVKHEGSKIMLYRARPFPPWMNAHLVLRSGDRTALAGIPAWRRRRVIAALRQNGFHVQENVSMFDSGYHLAR